jgi:hypothetical protein
MTNENTQQEMTSVAEDAMAARANNTAATDDQSSAIAPVAKNAGPRKADRTKPVKVFGMVLPGPLAGLSYTVQDFSAACRYHTIRALPGFVVNNSSNAIGMVQLVGEALMFKSGGFDLIDAKNKGNPIHWIIDPPKNIFQAVFKKAQFNGKLTDLLQPSKLFQSIKDFGDLETASKIDSIGKAGEAVKLTNRWSARSGFMGISAMTISTLLPEEKDTPEQTQKDAALAKNNPVGYYAYRLGQGLAFPITAPFRMVMKVLNPQAEQHIGAGKRQFAGIGMTLAGLFSFISGFRQVEGKVIGQQHYMKNPWQMAGGIITFFGGSSLMLGIDNQQGWTNYGAVQMGRLLTLGPSITNRFKPGPNGKPEQGAEWYLGAQGALQTKNLVAVLIGGAKKLPDGTVVDQKDTRVQALETAQANKDARKAHAGSKDASLPGDSQTTASESNDTAVPTTQLAKVEHREAAMPEAVAQHKAAQEQQNKEGRLVTA